MLDQTYSKTNSKIFLTPSQFGKLTSIIYNVLTKKMPSLNNLTEYLNKLIDVLIALDKPIIWITPSGLRISLSNVLYKSKLTKTRIVPNSKPVTISLPTNKLNYQKIKRSFMPNLIHSLDASNIHSPPWDLPV